MKQQLLFDVDGWEVCIFGDSELAFKWASFFEKAGSEVYIIMDTPCNQEIPKKYGIDPSIVEVVDLRKESEAYDSHYYFQDGDLAIAAYKSPKRNHEILGLIRERSYYRNHFKYTASTTPAATTNMDLPAIFTVDDTVVSLNLDSEFKIFEDAVAEYIQKKIGEFLSSNP